MKKILYFTFHFLLLSLTANAQLIDIRGNVYNAGNGLLINSSNRTILPDTTEGDSHVATRGYVKRTKDELLLLSNAVTDEAHEYTDAHVIAAFRRSPTDSLQIQVLKDGVWANAFRDSVGGGDDISSATFDSSTGNLSIALESGTTFNVSLDGRYKKRGDTTGSGGSAQTLDEVLQVGANALRNINIQDHKRIYWYANDLTGYIIAGYDSSEVFPGSGDMGIWNWSSKVVVGNIQNTGHESVIKDDTLKANNYVIKTPAGGEVLIHIPSNYASKAVLNIPVDINTNDTIATRAYLADVTSTLQGQIDSKANVSHTHGTIDIIGLDSTLDAMGTAILSGSTAWQMDGGGNVYVPSGVSVGVGTNTINPLYVMDVRGGDAFFDNSLQVKASTAPANPQASVGGFWWSGDFWGSTYLNGSSAIVTEYMVVQNGTIHSLKTKNPIPAFADDTAAGAGNVPTGEIYQLSTGNTYGLPAGVLMVKQ